MLICRSCCFAVLGHGVIYWNVIFCNDVSYVLYVHFKHRTVSHCFEWEKSLFTQTDRLFIIRTDSVALMFDTFISASLQQIFSCLSMHRSIKGSKSILFDANICFSLIIPTCDCTNVNKSTRLFAEWMNVHYASTVNFW